MSDDASEVHLDNTWTVEGTTYVHHGVDQTVDLTLQTIDDQTHIIILQTSNG